MIQFAPIKLNPEYAKEWNEHMTDFFHLCDEQGNKINDTLYRKGGIGGKFSDGYCIIIKHVETEYPDDITTDPKRKKHLASHFCVINEKGEEKMYVEHFGSITHYGGLLFSVTRLGASQKLYNVENGECFGEISSSLNSNEFVFFQFHEGYKNKGVKKVNKFTGEVEFFPLTR
jgi:hypothetical protein